MEVKVTGGKRGSETVEIQLLHSKNQLLLSRRRRREGDERRAQKRGLGAGGQELRVAFGN